VLQTLWSRIAEVDAEDAFYAFKHVYLARNPGAEFRKCDYEAFRIGAPPVREEAFPARHGDKDAVEAARSQRRGRARGRADDDVSGASSRSVSEIECGQIESTCERAS
jgi:hypothetical protein